MGDAKVHTQSARKGTSAASPENTLQVKASLGEDSKVTTARTALRPSVRAAITTQTYSKQFGELDLGALVGELVAQNVAVSKGDMGRVEGMLMSHAHTLDAIFHELARRAALNMGEYINAAETYMRLALKAQSQCRATLETLAAIKNPAPLTFVKQANVAHGPQQVNNGTVPTGEPSRARESESQPNKLLEQQHGEGLDTRAPRAPVEASSSLEAVEEVHGAANGKR
jgi:hypothetical protein